MAAIRLLSFSYNIHGADVQLSTVDRYTPLMIANQTALMLACKNQLARTVSLLLSSGADPNLQNDSGWTALMFSLHVSHTGLKTPHCAVKNDYRSLGIVRSLLEAGAVVNKQNSKGSSSLAIACKCGCYKIAELLIQYGADVQLSTINRFTPLMIACQAKHEDIAALLLRSKPAFDCIFMK